MSTITQGRNDKILWLSASPSGSRIFNGIFVIAFLSQLKILVIERGVLSLSDFLNYDVNQISLSYKHCGYIFSSFIVNECGRR